MFLLLLAACATTPSAKLGEPFTLGSGASANVDGLRVTFVEVLNDSRCPPNVQCIWEGDATVRIRLSDDTRSSDVELHTHRRYATSASALAYTVALRDLTRKPDYLAELVVTAVP